MLLFVEWGEGFLLGIASGYEFWSSANGLGDNAGGRRTTFAFARIEHRPLESPGVIARDTVVDKRHLVG